MPRKGPVQQRDVLPDPVYNSKLVTRFINKIMFSGKKSVAENIVYNAFDIIRSKTGKDPLTLFEAALNNIMPVLEVRARRVGGANYQVPMPVIGDRRSVLAIRWIKKAASEKKGKRMAEKLADELLDAVQKKGTAMKKREEVHRMAEANKAFAHFA